jgi:ABC-type multidrug transport system fused ATPase/permease subunit
MPIVETATVSLWSILWAVASVLFTCLVGTLAWFMKRTLSQIDKNQQTMVGSQKEIAVAIAEFKRDIYEKVNCLSDKFHELVGEHRARMDRGSEDRTMERRMHEEKDERDQKKKNQ